jgi:hypothetical protein
LLSLSGVANIRSKVLPVLLGRSVIDSMRHTTSRPWEPPERTAPDDNIKSDAQHLSLRPRRDVESISTVRRFGRNKREEVLFRWRGRLPAWITAKALEIACLKVPDGWQFPLRVYQVIPQEHEAFYAVLFGNLKRVTRLLAEGVLHPSARVHPEGHKLIHVRTRSMMNTTIFDSSRSVSLLTA